MENVVILIQGPTFDKSLKIGELYRKDQTDSIIPNTTALNKRKYKPDEIHLKMIEYYSWFPNVYWSTWEDEPEKNLQNIEESTIKLILNSHPSFPGIMNVNRQIKSTYNGLLEIKKSSQVEYVLKVRSDMIIANLELLVDRLIAVIGDKIGVPFFHKLGHNFPCDFVHFGKIDKMIEYWNLGEINLGCDCAERELRNAHSHKYQIPNLYHYEEFLRYNYFFGKDMIELNSDIIWLKHEKRGMVKKLYNLGNIRF
jgi:hypothetical protein